MFDVYSMESEVDWLSTLSSAADAFANTSEWNHSQLLRTANPSTPFGIIHGTAPG